uniref:tetratricopeptide repeat-containing sensor histidine kinase n=2 Tax=Gelidibacter sp. TaxID=2018083 RepID=UPI00404AF55A
MKKIFIIIFALSSFCYGQNNTLIDSLTIIIKTSKNDSLKMMAYNGLRRATVYTDVNKSRSYGEKYIELAKKLKDSNHIALGHYFIGNIDVATGGYESALNNYLFSRNYFESINDSKRLCSILNAIGAVYEKTKNDSLSLLNYGKSLELSKSLKDIRGSGIASTNIGNIYINSGDLDKAILYLENGVNYLKQNPDDVTYLTISELNLATAYCKNKEFNKSKTIYNAVLTKIDTINDVYSYTGALRGLSTVFLDQNQPKLALPYAEKVFNIYTKNGFNDERFQIMPDLISTYKATGNYQKAINVYDEYNRIKDSIFTETQSKSIAEAVEKYESEKKDVQLRLLKVEGEKQEKQKQLYLFLSLAGLSIALLLGFFYYKNQKKNTLLARQKVLLEASIDEKNILLKETHHRVKNSFQIVSSLLYLQSETMQDKEAKIAIQEAQNRVRSMVLIHQKLYNKDQLVGIDTQDYFYDLVKDIFESHQFQKETVHYQLNVESIILDVETITPIGLILNELIINSLKHAFIKVRENSLLNINFKQEKDELILKVIDNGKGFEGEVKDTSFGIKLMKALCKKLKAELEFKSETQKGTEATLIVRKFNIL